MKIFTIRCKSDGLYLSCSPGRWVDEAGHVRIFGQKQDAFATIRQWDWDVDDLEIFDEFEILEHVCLPALTSDFVYVALPAEGDGVLGDWLEQYGLIDAAMVVRKHSTEGKV